MVTDPRASIRADRLRPLNQPEAVEVEVDEAGRPIAVTSRRGKRDVEEVVEIWRVDDEWWREPIARRYADIVLEGGAHMVLYEDLVTSEWFMQKP